MKLEPTTFCLVNTIDKLRYSSILPGNLNFNLFACFFFSHNFNKVEQIRKLGKTRLDKTEVVLACVDLLFSERELANGNAAGTFGFEKL